MRLLETAEELAGNPGHCYANALVATLRGEEEATTRHATTGVDVAAATGQRLWELGNRWALGHLALSRGDVVTADRHLAGLADLQDAIGMTPQVHRVSHDVTEAAVLVGDLERAGRLVADLEERGRATVGTWTAAGAARNRTLLALAAGDDAVLDHLDRALALARAVPDPHEQARTDLVAGIVRRRGGARAQAREHLDRAVATFADHGMVAWAERAAAERDRISGRRPASDDGLTETESQVAELAADGLTNREIADNIHLAEKTVKNYVSGILSKLEVSRRVEAAAYLVEKRTQEHRYD
jgi:DNA-binding CsgD family transcriptional regulator